VLKRQCDTCEGLYPASGRVACKCRCGQCKGPLNRKHAAQEFCTPNCRLKAFRKREASKNVAALTSSESNEWYTPAPYIEAARRTLGGFDLDPASCEQANATIQAARYFTEADDGLKQEWKGRIWLNPPYGRLAGGFVARLAGQYAAGNVSAAVVLVASSATSTSWFRPLWDGALCFTDHRINFNGVKGNTTGSIFAYLGPDRGAFQAEFAQFGTVVTRYERPA
jgi:phage N-6-adenine-methyltransferase